MTMASFSQVAGVLVPAMAATMGIYYVQRQTWPLGRTFNQEWYRASEEYLSNMPVTAAPGKTVRMNPSSDKIRTDALSF